MGLDRRLEVNIFDFAFHYGYTAGLICWNKHGSIKKEIDFQDNNPLQSHKFVQKYYMCNFLILGIIIFNDIVI